jgi:hypothetical protein
MLSPEKIDDNSLWVVEFVEKGMSCDSVKFVEDAISFF